MLGRASRVGLATAVAAAVGIGGTGVAQAAPATVQSHPVATWQTNGRVNAIAVSGNTVYLGGQFTSMRPPGAAAGTGEVARNHVAAVSLTTGALLPWNPDANSTVRALKVAGKFVYLGGAFTQVGGVGHARLAKVSATGAGAVVSTWKATASGEVFSLASSGGTIYAGGGFGTVDGSARANLAAIKGTDGTVLPWNPGTDGQVKAIKFVSATRLVVGGTFTHLAGASANDIGAVDPDSGNAEQWQGHITYPVIGLANDTAGLYVAGAGGGGNFAAFNPTTGASLWVGGTNGNVQAIGVVGGVVYLGGHFQTYCGPQHGQHTCTNPVSRNKLLAVDETNGGLLPWDPSANSVLGVFALQGVAANGDMLVGGDFTSTGQKKQQGYAQYTP
jgi:hypothetical protein